MNHSPLHDAISIGYPVDEGYLKLPKIVLLAMLAAMLCSVACGPQASQQGTWSRDDGFKHKTTLEPKEPKEKPAATAR